MNPLEKFELPVVTTLTAKEKAKIRNLRNAAVMEDNEDLVDLCCDALLGATREDRVNAAAKCLELVKERGL